MFDFVMLYNIFIIYNFKMSLFLYFKNKWKDLRNLKMFLL